MSTLLEVEAAIYALPATDQRVLLEKLSRHVADEGASCFDLVHDLFEDTAQLGASGLSDLSSNKAHLADFGR